MYNSKIFIALKHCYTLHFILEEQIYMMPMNKFIPVAPLGLQFRED